MTRLHDGVHLEVARSFLTFKNIVLWWVRNTQSLEDVVNLNLDEHEAGCKPMTNPCRTCRVVSFLRKRIGEKGLAELNRLLGSPMQAPAVEQPSCNFTPEQLLFLNADIRDLLDSNLSTRTAKCLKDTGIVTGRQLVSKTNAEMLAIQNFGRISLDEVKELLAQKGLHFGMELPDA